MTTVDHSKSNAIIAAVAAELPIGKVGHTPIARMQINLPMGNRTKFEAELRDSTGRLVVSIEHQNWNDLRRALAATAHIGFKYTDMVLEQTIDFNKRLNASIAGYKEQTTMSQFSTEHVTYSVCHHPAQQHVHFDKSKDRIEPEFFRAVAQNHAIEDPDDCLIFDECADTLFDAVVIIRNHIEKSLLKAFMPEIK